MSKEEISDALKEVISKNVNHSNFEITYDLTANDVDGWDSLTHMLIVNDIEEKLGIRFRLKELNKLKNVGSLIDLIATKL